MLVKLREMEISVAAIAVAATHCHALIEIGEVDAKAIFGRVKQHGSHALRDALPGKLWGASSGVFRIMSQARFIDTREYIWRHREQGAWVYAPSDDVQIRITRDVERLRG